MTYRILLLGCAHIKAVFGGTLRSPRAVYRLWEVIAIFQGLHIRRGLFYRGWVDCSPPEQFYRDLGGFPCAVLWVFAGRTARNGGSLVLFYWFLQVIRPLTGLTGDTVGIRHTTPSPH